MNSRGILSSLVALGILVACEEQLPPVQCEEVDDQTVRVGESVRVTACFTDGNDDPLTISAKSGDQSVATVSVSGENVVAIAGVAPGTTSIEVKATDPGGLVGVTTFSIVVHADVSGTFEGSVTGMFQGGTFSGTGSLTVTQREAGKLEGRVSISGKLVFMGEEIPLEIPPVPFTGTVAKGAESLKVDLVVSITDPDCGEITEAFSGTYTPDSKALVLSGEVSLLDDECQRVGALELTMNLSKK